MLNDKSSNDEVAQKRDWVQSDFNPAVSDPLHEFFEIFQARNDDWIREELTEFFEDLALIKHKESELSYRIQRKVLTEEGFSQSLDKMILNQFYQLALLDNYRGISESNYSFIQLYRIVVQYKFFNISHVKQLFEAPEYRGLDLESKVNFYINQAQIPNFSSCSNTVNSPNNELESLTKYVNISLALTVYAYISYEAKKENLAWNCLNKAKELYAYAVALQSFLNKEHKTKTSLGKVRGYRRKDLQFELFLSFVELELLKPEKNHGWSSIEEASQVIARRFQGNMMRIAFLHECKTDFQKKFNKDLEKLIAEWIEQYDSLRYIFESNKLNQKDYELLGVSYYPFSPVKELSQLYSLGKFKNEPRPSAFKNTKINNKLSVSKDTIEELEEKAFLYSQLKYEHEKLKNKFMPQLREIEYMLDSNPQDDASLKDFQIEFLLSELKKKDRNTDYRDLLKNLARSCNN